MQKKQMNFQMQNHFYLKAEITDKKPKRTDRPEAVIPVLHRADAYRTCPTAKPDSRRSGA